MNLPVEIQNSNKKELTITSGNAQLLGLVFLIPTLIVQGLPYYLLWKEKFGLLDIHRAVPSAAIILIIILAGIVLHELIHGVTWAFYCSKGFKSIKFGIDWKSFTPYCHCSEPLLINQYRIGGAMPALLLGLLPSFFAIISGNLPLFFLGIFLTIAAGGDFLILWMLRNEPKDSLVQDHPDKIGCYVFYKE